MAEWVMGLISVLLCLFEGYCIQSFFGRFAAPKLCRRNAGWGAGIAWIVIRAFSEGLFSDTDSASLIMELLFTFCALFVFCVFWYQGNILLKIFLAVQFISLRELSFWAGYSLIYIGNEMIEAVVNKAGIGGISARGVRHPVLLCDCPCGNRKVRLAFWFHKKDSGELLQ